MYGFNPENRNLTIFSFSLVGAVEEREDKEKEDRGKKDKEEERRKNERERKRKKERETGEK